VIGQIHIDDSISSKPVAELYYDAGGNLQMGVEQTRAGGNQVKFQVGYVAVGQTFTYEIRYESNVLSVSINGGQTQILPTYSLNAPRSYFKAGNYNQGQTASNVHFFDIQVSHGTGGGGAPPPIWPPTGTDQSPHVGLGPFNILYKVDHTLSAGSPAPTSCGNSPPAVAGDNLVALQLYKENSCCTSVETIKMGTLDSCHNADAPFQGFYQSVGKNMFGRGIHVVTYEGRDCLGAISNFKLTNTAQCFPHGSNWQSFKIAVTSDSDGANCAPDPPAIASDNTISLKLFDEANCCTPVETIKLGTLDSCHNADAPFSSFVEAVGANMFGKDIHVQAYTSRDCGGTPAEYKLTNDKSCMAASSSKFLSFKIAVSDTPPQDCVPAQPDNDSDNTVTLDFFSQGCCGEKPFETAKIGKFGVCHKADQSFQSITQQVGQSLFGQGIHIQVYEDGSCGSSSFQSYDLSNKAVCYKNGKTYKSFMVSQGSGGGSGGSNNCNTAQPTSANDGTTTLDLYSGTSCCNKVENIKIGKLDVCHNTNGNFSSLRMAVGTNLFGNSNHVQAFVSRNCADNTFATWSLTNNDVCFYGSDKYNSFRIANGSAPSLPPQTCTQQPSNTNDNTMAVELSHNNNCCDASTIIGLGEWIASSDSGCVKAPTAFAGLTMRVGKNLFGKNIHIHMYDDPNCSSSSEWIASLSNNPTCIAGGPSGGWKSFSILHAATGGSNKLSSGNNKRSSGDNGGGGTRVNSGIHCSLVCDKITNNECKCACNNDHELKDISYGIKYGCCDSSRGLFGCPP
jgi:hypothetical protein